ncbi:MAG: xanthine dehydrogenase accessory protein XdhC [Paracoccaceae bacterium]
MFDRDALIDACTAHGRVTRVVVARVQGSAPREVGASMLVWSDGQSGTIGGGALEFGLAKEARALNQDRWTKHALGPDLGQCCGGAIEVLSEVYDLQRSQSLPLDAVARGPSPMPMSVTRILRAMRGEGLPPQTQCLDSWMIEPVSTQPRDIWIWGAGHVGRALVSVLNTLPNLNMTWIDTDLDRYPSDIDAAINVLPAADPGKLIQYAPKDANHFILTYSHTLDLDLCHQLLSHGFETCGLIGSKTKWVRFQKRLSQLGHSAQSIDSITCPIGDPTLGKHPQLIALGVAHSFVESEPMHHTTLRSAHS